MANYSKSTLLMIAAAEAAGEKVNSKSTLILSYDEGETIGSVYHDGMMYGAGRVNLSDVDEDELKADGVRIWKTWNYGEGIKK